MSSLVKFVQDEFVTKKDFPAFGAGDTLTVYYEIREGEKVRTQFLKVSYYRLKDLVLLKHSQLEKCLAQLVLSVSSQLIYLHFKKLKLIRRVKLEEQESFTLEVLLVRKQELKRLEENNIHSHKFYKALTINC
jgi:large subunit ribosomal protein L19